MAGILSGFIAGAAKGAVDVAKQDMADQSAADLAQVNANIATERDKRIRENTRAANAADAASVYAAVPAGTEDRPMGIVNAAIAQGNPDLVNQTIGAANLDRQTQSARETAREKNRANMSEEDIKRQALEDKRLAREAKAGETKTASYSAQTGRFNAIRDTIAAGVPGSKQDSLTGKYTIPDDNIERYTLAVSIAQKVERMNPGVLSPGELSQRSLDATSKFTGIKDATKKASGEADPGFFSKKPEFGGKTPDQWAEDRARELVQQSKKEAEANLAPNQGSASVQNASPYKEGDTVRSKKDGKLYVIQNGIPVLKGGQ